MDVTYFLTFVHRNIFETSIVFASELFEPEIEFPLSIFTLKECESNSLRDNLSTAVANLLRRQIFIVACVVVQKGLEAVAPGCWFLGVAFGILMVRKGCDMHFVIIYPSGAQVCSVEENKIEIE